MAASPGLARRLVGRPLLIWCGLAIAAAFAPAQSVGTANGNTPPQGTSPQGIGAAVDFRTPDGTRVVLLPMAGSRTLTWAIASPTGPTVDPAGAPGLAAATVHASMRGTWRIGSLDAAAERTALLALDRALEAYATMPPGSDRSAAAARVDEARAKAANTADAHAFRRVLAAAPTTDLEIHVDDEVAVLTFTTSAMAVPAVARLLLDRRENAVLRGIDLDLATWQTRAIAHFDGSATAPLYAEVLAMAFPGHPLARAGDRPNRGIPGREIAAKVWARSQHPTRTVHTLVGDFDPAIVRAHLEQAFATTALATPEALPPATPRTEAAVRRSLVPGARHPAALIAFPIAPGTSREAVATAAGWLAGGADSFLAKELARLGRPAAKVSFRAPWPESAATGLLVLEVEDQPGAPVRLADDVIAALAQAAKAVPEPAALQSAFAQCQVAFTKATDGRPASAAFVASRALLDPDAPLPTRPSPPPFAELPQWLRAVLATHPVVVEWRDA